MIGNGEDDANGITRRGLLGVAGGSVIAFDLVTSDHDRSTTVRASTTAVSGTDQTVALDPTAETELIVGATYPVLIAVDVGESGLLDVSGRIEEPTLEIDVDWPGSYDVIAGDYHAIEENGTSVLSAELFRERSSHHAVVLLDVTSDHEPLTVTCTAYGDDGNTLHDEREVTFSLSHLETAAWDEMERAAARRRDLMQRYADAYDAVVSRTAWEDEFQTAMRDALGTIAVSKGKTLAKGGIGSAANLVGAGETVGWLDTGATAYGIGTGRFTDSTTEQLMRSVTKLKNDLFDHMHQSAVDDAGEVDARLAELIELSEEEITAWSHRNREALLENVKEQLNTVFKTRTGAQSLYQEARKQRYYPNHTTRVVPPDPQADIQEFFESVQDFAIDDRDHLEDLRRMLTPPSPDVTLETGREALATSIADLAPGESVEASFVVKNSSGAGPTSSNGYFSISHADALSVEVLDPEELTVAHAVPGEDEIVHRDGELRLAVDHLVDAIGQYEPGHQRKLSIRITRVEEDTDLDPEELWLTYRTAFQPMLTDNTLNAEAAQEEFARFPDETGDGIVTDQQDWPAYRVSADDAVYPPSAVITVSDQSIDTATEITLDARGSTGDAPISEYEWRLSGEGTDTRVEQGELVTTTLSGSGTWHLELTVTDERGETDTTTETIVVREAPPDELDARIRMQPSTIEPMDEVTFRAAVEADTYNWTIGENTYSGASVTHTFDTAATYEVSLEVSRGDTTDTASRGISVESFEDRLTRPRALISGAGDLLVGETAQFSGEESYHPAEATIDSYQWTITGTEYVGSTVEYAFDTAGDYTIELEVTDENGHTDTTDAIVTVVEETPEVGELPPGFEDGNVDIDFLQETLEYAIAEYSFAFEYAMTEHETDADGNTTLSLSEAATLAADQAAERAIRNRGWSSEQVLEHPEDGADHQVRYYDPVFSYRQSISDDEEPSYRRFDADFDGFIEQVTSDLSHLVDIGREISFADPVWDDDQERYELEAVGIDLDPDVNLENGTMYVDEDGVITAVNVSLRIDGEDGFTQLSFEGAGNYEIETSIDVPGWVDDNFDRGRIAGTVSNYRDEPLEDVTVIVSSEDFEGTFTTDASGQFEEYIPAGLYDLSVAPAGYTPVTTEVEVEIYDQDSLGIVLQPIARGPTLYFGSNEGTNTDPGAAVYAIDAATGDKLWRRETDHFVASSPTVADGIVYVGTDAGNVLALYAGTGEVKWMNTGSGRRIRSSPTLDADTLYIGDRGDRLHAIDRESGETKWTNEFDTWVDASPFVTDGSVYIGMDPGGLYALDAESGEEQWVFTEPEDARIETSPVVVDGVVYGKAVDGVYAIDQATGEQIWAANDVPFRSSTPPVVANGMVYLDGDPLTALEATTGDVRWSAPDSADPFYGGLTIEDGTVYSIDNRDRVRAIDAFTGEEIWMTEYTDGFRSKPTVFDGTVVVGGYGGRVHAFSTADGHVAWSVEVAQDNVASTPTGVTDPLAGDSVCSRVRLGSLGHLPTVEIPDGGEHDLPLQSYVGEDDMVDTPGLRNAVEDWRGGDIDTGVLREVVDYWRSGKPVK